MGRGPTEKYHQQLHPLFAKGSLTCLSKDTMERHISNDSPLTLNIEPTNNCNLRCDYCPGERARKMFGIHSLTVTRMQDILKTLPALKERLLWVNFHKDGEPLMNPFLDLTIRTVGRLLPNTITHLNTNGALLTPRRGRQLLNAGLNDMTVSIDAAWPDSYNRRKGLKPASQTFQNVVENALAYCTLSHPTPSVSRVKMIEFADTSKEEIEDFYKLWTGVADQVQVTGAHDWSGAVKGTEITDFNKLIRHACPLLWHTLAINSDETVSICNVDWNRSGQIGNLRYASLQEIWQSDRLKEIRQMHLYGYFDSPRMPEVCKECVVWAGAADMDEFLKTKVDMV